jgi:hypothetical protein
MMLSRNKWLDDVLDLVRGYAPHWDVDYDRRHSDATTRFMMRHSTYNLSYTFEISDSEVWNAHEPLLGIIMRHVDSCIRDGNDILNRGEARSYTDRVADVYARLQPLQQQTQTVPVGKTKPDLVWDAALDEWVIVAPEHVTIRDDRRADAAAPTDLHARRIIIEDEP